jgi:DNA-binding response OmpR family regulator
LQPLINQQQRKEVDMLATTIRGATPPAALHAPFAAGGTRSSRKTPGLAVLLADDDRDVRRWLRREIEDSLADIVVEATDGAELAARLGERRFDLVVSDVQMPAADGVSVAEALRRRGDDTPFLFITGELSTELRVRVRRLGGATVLAKPLEIEELEGAAGRLLGRTPAQ